MRIFRAVGIGAAVLAWVLCVITQAVAHDFLPPAVSVSQYGVGPHGWIFTCWMLTMCVALVGLYRAEPNPSQTAARWLGVGIAGMVVMAVVRTDPGGLQHSVNAKVHLAGAVLTLGALPVGITLALRSVGRRWAQMSAALTAGGAVALALLLLAAVGVDTAGVGPTASWAWWQSVALVLDMVMLAVFATGVGWQARARPLRPQPSGAGRPRGG